MSMITALPIIALIVFLAWRDYGFSFDIGGDDNSGDGDGGDGGCG